MNRVAQLQQILKSTTVGHKRLILGEPTLKDAHVYCVTNSLSAQKFGPLLEAYIIDKWGFTKNKATDCTGDCQKNCTNTEIKVSLGGQTFQKFNYVQIRVHHYISTYLLTAYVLNAENVESEGELFVFRVPHEAIIALLLRFGSYAHGTKAVNGEITAESLNDTKNTKEYALRTTYGDDCWKVLLEYRVEESDL